MNNRGQTYLTIILAIFFLLAGIVLLNFVKDDQVTARTNLNCDSPSTISDGNKATCLIINTATIYLFIVIGSIAGGHFTSKLFK